MSDEAILQNAYYSFLNEYCKTGDGYHTLLTVFQDAFIDYLHAVGLSDVLHNWENNNSGFLLLRLDEDLIVRGYSTKVVVGIKLTRWPT